MNKKQIIGAILAITMLPIGGIGFTKTANAASGTVVRLDPSDASPFNDGEFEGWGTSMGWWGNRIGYSDELAEQAAQLFYSEEGLGLDIVRYNVGGGDDPTHNHITRSDSKLPCFAVPQTNADGSLKKDADGNVLYAYNWNNDYNQVNVLKKIKEQNDNVHIEGYTNSPPWFMTKTGCSGGGKVTTDANGKVTAIDENLDPANYAQFAKFLADVTEHFDEIGLTFDSYSPMNEPNPAAKYWGEKSPKQEGNHVAPGTNQSGLINALSAAYDERDIDTLVVGLDETSIDYSITSFNNLTETAKANLDRLDTHTYGGSNRAGLKAAAINGGKNLWMSEVDGGWNGFGLADRIITDLNGMQASAWVMWDIVDFHKDSNFTDPSGNKTEANASMNPTATMWGVAMANHDTKTIELSNKYYAFGQFSRYINPGDTLIASSSNTLAAYNKETGAIKIVVSNSSEADKKYTFDLSAFKDAGNVVTEVRSNNKTGAAAEHWETIIGEAELKDKKITTTAKAGTVTTYIVENFAFDTLSMTESGLSFKYTPTENIDNYNKYLVVYDSKNTLKYVSDKTEDTVQGDFSGCTARLYVWEDMVPVMAPVTQVKGAISSDYAIIKGGSEQINLDSSVELNLVTNIESETVTWTVSDDKMAQIKPDGKKCTVTARDTGKVTVSATVGDFTVSREFNIPLYTVTGTASWGNDSNRPSDSADYLKAVDGDLSTYFDGTTGGYVQYDYGKPFKISEINLAARSGNGMPERTVGGTVQGSNDGITWTDLYKITAAIPADKYTTVTASELENNKAYRYFRYINTQNMANIAEFIIDGEPSDDVPAGAPSIKDIAEFTDNFEGAVNIFSAPNGTLAEDISQVYASGLERFNNVFMPVKETAVSALSEAIELSGTDKFRLTFNMFAGWESSGKDNTFAIKDKDGNEIAALYMTGGGYNFNQIRVGGSNVLSSSAIAQCRSNPGSSKSGANGWNVSGQAYVNNVGYNKTVEIIIDGTGAVSISATGGMEDTKVSGTISAPVSIGSIELTGDYNSARERVVSYDNLNGDLITYSTDLPKPTPTPVPTAAPVMPESGELISLNFDNGDLTSASAYGKASGTPKFAEVDGKKCAQLDNTNATVIKLTDANGNPLLTGQKNITVSFKVKPTGTTTSWWFYSSPNDSAPTFQQEKYLGALTKSNTIEVERYNNSGSRSAAATTALKANEWNDVMISFDDGVTDVYVNGVHASADSTVNIADMLGNNSVAYIGKANWGSGEYATGYIDDFVIYNHAIENPLGSIDLGDLSAVTEDITVLTEDGVTWETSDAAVVTADGKVTRADDTKTAVLTAKTVKDGIEFSKSFTVTVTGYTAVLDSFAAYAEGNSIKYTSDYTNAEKYDMTVILETELGPEEPLITKDNQASGELTGLVPNRSYYVTCELIDKESRNVVKKISKTFTIKENKEMEAYLFVHFMNTESDATCEQIYFSVSEDGQSWTTLNDKKPVLTSNVGEKGVRDPYILRGEDGKFFIIATDLSIYNTRNNGKADWGRAAQRGSKSIVVWESDDLVTWSEASIIKINNDNAGCTWAPEACYDPERDEYMVFWASVISDDSYSKFRIYRSYTSDFKTFSAPELYIEEPNAVIDTTIIDHKGVYYRFTKNEARSSITMQKCTTLNGNWKDVETYTLGDMTGYEGPTIYKMNGEDKWCLLLDYFSKSQGYKPFVTSDITKGNFTAGTAFTFDGTYRHGTVMPITKAEYTALKNAQW